MNKAGVLARLMSGLMRAPRTLGFAESFLAAWNAHDADKVAAMVGSGHYADPLSKGHQRAETLRDHAQTLFSAFPDLSFELDGPITVGDQAVAARYTLKGTNTGALPGGLGIERVEPTGKRILLEATIFLRFKSDGAVEVDNSFDLETLAEQLGFYALLMPRTQGHYQFGAFYRLNKGNVQPPEAIGITWLQLRDPDQFENAARITNAVAESFSDRPGFVTGIVGARPPDENGLHPDSRCRPGKISRRWRRICCPTPLIRMQCISS